MDDIKKLDDVETARLMAMVEVAPNAYRIYTNGDGCFECDDPTTVDRFNCLRDTIVGLAFKADINVANLCPILLELAARGFHNGMTRETFVRNAEFWYDSAAFATTSAQTNTVGGAG